MSNSSKYQSAAVITSTIGRPELIRAIQSVEKQTYPCTHYVFVDGQQFAEQAKVILDCYPQVVALYLPMNTGADGWTNSAINAIAPFLIKEDVICYLDDDNWYAEDHIERCISALNHLDVDCVYALRNIYASEQELICQDFIESLGFYKNLTQYPIQFDAMLGGQMRTFTRIRHKKHHIDTNCYAVPRTLALSVSSAWYSGKNNDTVFFNKLLELNLRAACTNCFSVNYLFDVYKQDFGWVDYCRQFDDVTDQEMISVYYDTLRYEYLLNYQAYGNKYPWEKL